MTDGHSLFPNTNYKIICEEFVDAKHRCNFVNWEPTGNFSTIENFPEHLYGKIFSIIKNFLNIIQLWLVSLMPAVQDAGAVEGVDMGVGSPPQKDQVHYLVKVVKLGPARTSKEMSSPSDLAIKEKMETCYVPPRRSWHYILVPPMKMMHVRSA